MSAGGEAGKVQVDEREKAGKMKKGTWEQQTESNVMLFPAAVAVGRATMFLLGLSAGTNITNMHTLPCSRTK